MWKLQSPNRTLTLQVEQTVNGALTLSAWKYDQHILTTAPLALNTDTGNFGTDLQWISEQRTDIREFYSLPVGKLSVYQNNANELLLTFDQGALRLRAYDEGLAFRHELDGMGAVQITGENTAFAFDPAFDTLYAQGLIPTYERPYFKRAWSDMVGQPFGMPLLLEGAGLWLLLSEANVLTGGQYCSCHLMGDEERTLRVAFAREQLGAPLAASLPLHTPWRILTVAESLNELVRTHLCYNVNDPAAQIDFSWVKPARSLWAWWEYENGAQLYTESKRYIDNAAAMGFEAVTLDCGWDANWVKPLCDYAHAQGVQLWLWTGRHRVDTPETMERYLPLWASWGVDGLKIDFFEDDSQKVVNMYKMLAERMAELHLMINFHGATKPMGEGRTWPHFMTAEGIMGLEHYKWSDMPDACHNCTVPFTRNVSGPMDYTPVGFSNPNRNTTHAHQLALPVVFDSGVTHYALSVYHLEGWAGTRFLARTKAHYDEIRLLAGCPGHHVAMLRRAGEEFFIGALTTVKQELALPMDFLPEGEFLAECYEDDEKDQLVLVRTLCVTRDSQLLLPLLENGGAAVYIGRTLEPPKGGVRAGYAIVPTQVVELAGGSMHGGSEPMRWNDGRTGVLLSDRVDVRLTVPEGGRYTLRLLYTSESPWEVRVQSECDDYRGAVPTTQSHYDFLIHDVALTLAEGENVVKLSRAGGAVPAVASLQVLNNHPQQPQVYPATIAKFGVGAELAATPDHGWEAVNLGEQADITFDSVTVKVSGCYILNITYCGGESRDISIEVNGGQRIDTYLHSTAGWGFPTWGNPEGKEVLVTLREGANSIRLSNDHGAMSHIRAITVTLDA